MHIILSPAPDKVQEGPSRSRTWNNSASVTAQAAGANGSGLDGPGLICSLLGGESSVDLLVKLGSPAVKFVILRPLAVHVLALSYGYTVRRKTQQDIWSSSQSSLTDEEEINEPVACFCIQSGSL